MVKCGMTLRRFGTSFALRASSMAVGRFDQSMRLFTLARNEGAEREPKHPVRKCGDRCHKMKAKIAKFSANQMPQYLQYHITILNT
jgi:hypothetical protein